MTRWLRGIDGLAKADPQPASGDASFRRYFRVHSDKASYIAMDAPPAREDSRPFVQIAGYLESMQLKAPRVLEANLDDGFLLLTDLGATQYLELLEEDRSSAVAKSISRTCRHTTEIFCASNWRCFMIGYARHIWVSSLATATKRSGRNFVSCLSATRSTSRRCLCIATTIHAT